MQSQTRVIRPMWGRGRERVFWPDRQRLNGEFVRIKPNISFLAWQSDEHFDSWMANNSSAYPATKNAMSSNENVPSIHIEYIHTATVARSTWTWTSMGAKIRFGINEIGSRLEPSFLSLSECVCLCVSVYLLDCWFSPRISISEIESEITPRKTCTCHVKNRMLIYPTGVWSRNIARYILNDARRINVHKTTLFCLHTCRRTPT